MALDPPGRDRLSNKLKPMGVATWDGKDIKVTQAPITLRQFHRWLHRLQPRPDKVIIEPFIFSPEAAQTRGYIDITPAEYVGLAKGVLHDRQIPFVLQQASVAVGRTAFWGDGPVGNAHMRQAGVWFPDARPHGLDAARHLLYFLTFVMGDDQWLKKLGHASQQH